MQTCFRTMNFPPLKSQRIILWAIALFFLVTGLVVASYAGYLYDRKIESDVLEAISPQVNSAYLVISVIDGDTFNVLINGEKQTIRLIAVDAPESKHPTKPVQCFSAEARDYLQELIENKYVTMDKEVLDDNKDRYGRLLRYVFINGININELLLKNGYALEKTYVKGYKYQLAFKKAQTYAQTNKLGLWSSSTCDGDVNFKAYLAKESPVLEYAYDCDCTKTCSGIKTCKEAIFQLEVCKCAGRDPDGNGRPCENVCH